MTSSQVTLRRLNEASKGIRAALDALDKIPNDGAPRVTIDGIQHELREAETRLEAMREDLVPAGKQVSSDQE